jgi:type II secretion system (T2SS) protein M
MNLWQRILDEKRALVISLALGIGANVAAYALIVRPLGVKSAGAADRAAAATRALRAAESEEAAARALMAGKARADEELATFYEKVLPPDLPTARQLTFATLPALARRANVKFVERRTEADQITRTSKFGRLKVHAVFQGEYQDLRQFIYQLEGAPEFVIIDAVTLSQPDSAKPLQLLLDLSTYYRLEANAQ